MCHRPTIVDELVLQSHRGEARVCAVQGEIEGFIEFHVKVDSQRHTSLGDCIRTCG